MIKKPITIIIPTWNNPEYLNPCVMSIIKTGVLNTLADLIIVNNGKQPCQEEFGHIPGIKVLTADKNLGWEGGLKLGIENSDTPFLVFQNDDTFIPVANFDMYKNLLLAFTDPSVGIVSPSTTVAAGIQSIFHPNAPLTKSEAAYLIFFTVMVRRSALEKIGGVDDTLHGGDDIDMSIRMRLAGYKLLIEPRSFLIHHGFKTGERVKGSHEVAGGWNSIEMIDKTNHDLIAKHGLKNFYMIYQQPKQDVLDYTDKEGNLISAIIGNSNSVLELGCGHKKTVPSAIGIDIIENGKKMYESEGLYSIADIKADVSKDLCIGDKKFDFVIARHVLEHCLDIVGTLKLWKSALSENGQLIIAVPDETITKSIPLNPEHCHAFSVESLKSIADCVGLEYVTDINPDNGVSFILVLRNRPEKALHITCSDAMWFEG